MTRALTEAERSWISSRLKAITPHADAPLDENETLVEVGKINLAFPQSGVEHGADQWVEAYAEGLAGLPAWSIRAARQAWMRGDRTVFGAGANFAFAPAPGQLAEAARALLVDVRGEAIRLRRLFAARVERPASPAMTERINTVVHARPPRPEPVELTEAERVARIREWERQLGAETKPPAG